MPRSLLMCFSSMRIRFGFGVLTAVVVAACGSDRDPGSTGSSGGTGGVNPTGGSPTGGSATGGAVTSVGGTNVQGGTPGSGGGSAGGSPSDGGTCQVVTPGSSPMRRLTRFEYDNTVRDLLGDTTQPASGFPSEEIGNGFGNDASALRVSRLLAEQYVSAAKSIAERVLADAPRYANMLGCDPTAGEDACASTFIDSFGARAYRRPLTRAERDGLVNLYGQVRALSLDFKTAVGAVLQAMLQAPPFLYRVEFGAAAPESTAVVKVGPYEMASRLSYFLWGSMPDAALLDAAASNRLSTPQQVQAQAERLLGDNRARAMVGYFNDMLFGLAGIERISKNPAQFPELTAQVPGLLKQESRQFLDYVIWDGPGDLKTLLTAPYSFMNEELAHYYGVADRPNAPKGAAFERIELDPTRAAGLLTQAGLLASLTPGTQTNPVLRGLFVRKNLLCNPPPPPPPALMVQEPSPDATLSTRERFKAHSEDATCYACHQMLDPVGFTFEHYDPVGRWRDTDNEKPIDSSGELIGTDAAGPVADAIGLAAKLATSQDVQKCLVGQWLTYSYGRAETAEDACTREALESAFAQSGGRIKDLLIALTQTNAFLYRPAVKP